MTWLPAAAVRALLAAAASSHGRVMPTTSLVVDPLVDAGYAQLLPDRRPVVVITAAGRVAARQHRNQQH